MTGPARSDRLVCAFVAGAALCALALPAAGRPVDDAECFGSSFVAPAQEVRKVGTFDDETGRDLANYPPHTRADAVHMKLEIDIPDMDVPRLTATETLTIRGMGRPLPTLSLDARLMEIEGVWSRRPGDSSEERCPYDYDGRVLTVRLTPPLPPGETREIITRYTVNDPRDGLFWTLGSPPGSGVWPGRPPQIYTQGEPETNSYWFPCHDSPNDRLTTELIVNAPAGYLVSSNGRLVSRHSLREGSGPTGSDRLRADREVWHYSQDKPHPAYLVTMVVGRFDVVDVNTAAGALGRPAASTGVPMPVYVPPGRGPDVKRTYGRTPRMVDLFARLTGRPYAWDKYAQVVVWNFGWGGMENTSATTMYDTAILSEAGAADGDLDGLISHELAHQWFGDLITCNSWEHIWLNEGFATYFSHLWFEERDGRDAYLAGVRANFDGLADADKAEAPYAVAMVSKDYQRTFDVFRKPANPYGKGAAILHMLRVRLGDDVFFRGLQEYVRRFALRDAETSDLREVLEEVSGDSLERFFAQWCYRPGTPDLDVATEWDSAAGEVVVSVVQKQNIDGYNPAFAFDLPVYVAFSAGSAPAGATGTVHVDSRETTARFACGGEPPLFVEVDPGLAVLARISVRQPEAAWLEQLNRGTTYAARVQAVRALRGEQATGALAALAERRTEKPSLRAEAVRALREQGGASVLMELLRGALDPVDVRAAAISALGDSAAKIPADNLELRSQCADLLSHLVEQDPSEQCRAAAVRALGQFRAVDRQALILAAAEQESQNDRIRQAAIQSLADLDTPEALAAAVRFSGRGYLSRTRPEAVDAVAKLGRHDPDTAFRTIAGLLTDRELRTRQAAGRALVRLGDPRGIGELEYEASRSRDDSEQRRYADLASELKKKLAPPAPDAPADNAPAK